MHPLICFLICFKSLLLSNGVDGCNFIRGEVNCWNKKRIFKTERNSQDIFLCQYDASGNVNKAALAFIEPTSLATFAVISKASPAFLIRLLLSFLMHYVFFTQIP